MTLTSFEPLEHDNNQGSGEDDTLDISTLVNLVATVTVTDGDLDQIVQTSTTASPLGLSFVDTNPTLNITAPVAVGPMSVVEDSAVAGHSVAAIVPPSFTASAVDGYTSKRELCAGAGGRRCDRAGDDARQPSDHAGEGQ